MFAKVKEQLEALGKPRSRAGLAVPSIVGPDMVLTGNLDTPGAIQVEGQVLGDISCSRLVIGPAPGRRGRVQAGFVRVQGRLTGAIDADEIYLIAGSEVSADVTQARLEIAMGALFDGAVHRRPPRAALPAPEARKAIAAPHAAVAPSAPAATAGAEEEEPVELLVEAPPDAGEPSPTAQHKPAPLPESAAA